MSLFRYAKLSVKVKEITWLERAKRCSTRVSINKYRQIISIKNMQIRIKLREIIPLKWSLIMIVSKDSKTFNKFRMSQRHGPLTKLPQMTKARTSFMRWAGLKSILWITKDPKVLCKDNHTRIYLTGPISLKISIYKALKFSKRAPINKTSTAKSYLSEIFLSKMVVTFSFRKMPLPLRHSS